MNRNHDHDDDEFDSVLPLDNGRWKRLAIVGGILSVVGLIGCVLVWNAFFKYVPPGKHLVIIAKNGAPLDPGEVLAKPGQKGIQAAVMGEGLHFVMPIIYTTEVEENTIIPAGKVGIVTALGGTRACQRPRAGRGGRARHSAPRAAAGRLSHQPAWLPGRASRCNRNQSRFRGRGPPPAGHRGPGLVRPRGNRGERLFAPRYSSRASTTSTKRNLRSRAKRSASSRPPLLPPCPARRRTLPLPLRPRVASRSASTAPWNGKSCPAKCRRWWPNTAAGKKWKRRSSMCKRMPLAATRASTTACRSFSKAAAAKSSRKTSRKS